jgi:hypothetical protein
MSVTASMQGEHSMAPLSARAVAQQILYLQGVDGLELRPGSAEMHAAVSTASFGALAYTIAY